MWIFGFSTSNIHQNNKKCAPTSLGHRSQRWSSTKPQDRPKAQGAQGQARQEVMMEAGRFKPGMVLLMQAISGFYGFKTMMNI